MPEVHELITGPISCHCWNGDRTSKSPFSTLLSYSHSVCLKTPDLKKIPYFGQCVPWVTFNSIFCFLEFAMSPNNHEVHIYSKKAGKWEREKILSDVSTFKATNINTD